MPFLILALCVVLIIMWLQLRKAARAEFIRSYMFPVGLLDKLQKTRPELSLKDRQLVAHALRQFFLVYHKSRHHQIAMPSQVVDDLWHEFILYTKNYQTFCQKAFGRYLHHTPASAMGANNNEGLRKVWHYACLEENINPKHPTRLPLLFALDAKWNLADGFYYAPNCRQQTGNGTVHCGADFFTSDSGGSSSDSSDSSGCSGGGSGGCGGGGGGGD
ncbi:glycine-rich domain-containing protein [Janthinobacterium sp. B9-8]|uniref:glycine-rich domain-containing protein n=1 Tax=Janthinobacterium sp. B9-8 TaxID=1236179 RepID=UPI0007645B9D|nr:hypothetical protein [Janthinobacterium sp. B9-8]AMC33824.1 hypothetical protein VN23_04025 [Janthinobacterium sp. B9-8]